MPCGFMPLTSYDYFDKILDSTHPRSERGKDLQLASLRFWRWFGNDHAIANIKSARFKEAEQRVRADIAIARLKHAGKGSEHRRFLQVCQSSLEVGYASPQKVQEALRLYEGGSCPSECLQSLSDFRSRKSA